jgi:hypothetical protein
MTRRSQQRLRITELAAIQYVGINGITQPCLAAIARQLSALDELINKAALLTCDSDHGFLLFTEYDTVIAVKPGFASGYPGEGPRGLAAALTLLQQHNVDVQEYLVDSAYLERLENSCLLTRDIDAVVNGRPIRPRRLSDYTYGYSEKKIGVPEDLSRHYPPTMPLGIIDQRISDLATRFRDGEDIAILSAFRRLEDLLRKRTGLNGEGTNLFSKIFLADQPLLTWAVPDKGEIKGRGNLFNAVYMAFRNARAHREVESGSTDALREFLLVNELYRLEAEAMTETELKSRRDYEASLEKTRSS